LEDDFVIDSDLRGVHLLYIISFFPEGVFINPADSLLKKFWFWEIWVW